MTKSYGDQTLKDFVMVQRNLIPRNLCEYIIDDSEKKEWRPHTWYNSQTDTFGSEETMELDVQNVNDEIQNFGELVWDPMEHLDQEEFLESI